MFEMDEGKMAGSTGDMPRPTAIWIALAIVTWATATALGPTRRARFVAALERLAGEHAARDAGRPVNLAATWIGRMVSELRAAE